MLEKDEFHVLRNTGLFDNLDDRALLEVYQARKEETHAPGEYFFFQDDAAERTYILVAGRVKLLQITPDGQQVILRIISPVTLFGLIGMLEDSTYPVTAEVLDASRAFYWTQGDFRQLILRFPQIAQNAMQLMAGQVKEFQSRFREMATERVERRIARALLRLARQAGQKTGEGIEIKIPISRQELAEMSGTSLFTVSRTLSDWDRRGLILAGRERVVIVKPHALVEIAEDLPGTMK